MTFLGYFLKLWCREHVLVALKRATLTKEAKFYTGCFKKSFTTLKAYRNLYRGHTQGFELSKCNKTHRVLPRIVMVQRDFQW